MVGVVTFESKINDVSQAELDSITDLFIKDLATSKKIKIIDRTEFTQKARNEYFEQSAEAELRDVIGNARKRGIQYILAGSVTKLTRKVSGESALFISSSSAQSKVAFEMRVIDVNTSVPGVVLKAESSSSTTGGGIGFKEFAIGTTLDETDVQAIANAVANLASDARAMLSGEVFHVIGVNSDGIAIDTAANEGARYLVYIPGEDVKDLEGNVIGKNKTPIAVIQVREAEAGHSIADLVKGQGSLELIRRGDSIEPISVDDAAKLAKGKKFITKRPAVSKPSIRDIIGESIE
jgi:TolB-like protein